MTEGYVLLPPAQAAQVRKALEAAIYDHDEADSLCHNKRCNQLRAAALLLFPAEVERLKSVIEAVHGIRHDNLIMAQRLAKWRDLCLDEIADLKLSLAVFEQGAVVDAKLIKNLEAERDAAYRAVEAKEEIIKIAERCVEERDEARADAERLQGYLDEECRLRREAQDRSAELDHDLTEAWLERDEAYTCARMAEERVARLVEGNVRYKSALEKIMNMDYRGNACSCSMIAREVLARARGEVDNG